MKNALNRSFIFGLTQGASVAGEWGKFSSGCCAPEQPLCIVFCAFMGTVILPSLSVTVTVVATVLLPSLSVTVTVVALLPAVSFSGDIGAENRVARCIFDCYRAHRIVFRDSMLHCHKNRHIPYHITTTTTLMIATTRDNTPPQHKQ